MRYLNLGLNGENVTTVQVRKANIDILIVTKTKEKVTRRYIMERRILIYINRSKLLKMDGGKMKLV